MKRETVTEKTTKYTQAEKHLRNICLYRMFGIWDSDCVRLFEILSCSPSSKICRGSVRKPERGE